MTNHKATPEQWAMLEEQSAPEYDSTILELRTRVEVLEELVQELEACLRLVEIDAGEDAYDFARYIRAVLARWGRPAIHNEHLSFANSGHNLPAATGECQ